MKKVVLVTVMLFFSWQFCIAISQTQDCKTAAIIKNTSLVQNTSDFINPIWLTNLFRIENSINEPNNFFPLSKKNQIKTNAEFSKIIESVFFNTLSQYITLSRNHSLQFQKTDIIFPFHNFW